VASETDAAGNTGTASLTFTLDTTAPAVTERLANDTGVSASDQVTSDDTLSGSSDPNAIVTLKEAGAVLGTAMADGGGNWSFSPKGLADGTHRIIASETDLAGNVGLGSLVFALETVAPTVTRVGASIAAGGEVTTGHSLRIGLLISAAASVSGSPVLLLNDGGTASFDAAHSSAKALIFNYTVASGQVTSDLRVSGIELDSSSAITDLAGNPANLAGAGADLGLGINAKAGGAAGPSSLTINGKQELELFGPSTAGVTFGPGSAGTFKLDDSMHFGGTVAGLAQGNGLDLADILFQGNSTPSYDNNTGILSVKEGANTATIALLGNYAAGSFVASTDGHTGTFVTDPPAIQQPVIPHS
jgi:hypothetical protein